MNWRDLKNKTIKKDKTAIAIMEKEKRSNRDIWYLFTKDPVLRIILLLPVFGILWDLMWAVYDIVALLMWVMVYPIIFIVLKYIPGGQDKNLEELERLMPKRQNYGSLGSFLKAWFIFVKNGIKDGIRSSK